jgi:hypothetical protein
MRILSASLLLCTALAAQGVTSPVGLNAVEGNTVFYHWAGSRRFQQIDDGQTGSPRLISSISWRRNANATGAAGTRTFDLKVDLGRGDFGRVSHLLDENFLPSTRTTVFNQTGVVFPDWSASLPGPTPFDFKITLPTPYAYTGANALVIDFSYLNSSSSSLLQTDRDFVGPTTPPAGTILGTGCTATGRASPFAHTAYMINYGTTPSPSNALRYRLGGSNAPAGGVAVALIDGMDRNITGAFCTTLHTLPIWSIPLSAQANGLVNDVSLGFTYNPAYLGITLYSQLAALDPGLSPIPIALSNARVTTMPASPVTGSHRCSYAWLSLPSTTGNATHFIGGGMVMLLQ